MNQILQQLRAMKDFSPSEKHLTRYILEHPEAVLYARAEDTARQAGVSMAVVYRLCRKLSLTGFMELKTRLAEALPLLEGEKRVQPDYPFEPHKEFTEIADRLLTDFEQTLLDQRSLLDGEQLKQAVFALEKAKQIDVYASAGNLYFVSNFQFQLKEIGRRCQVEADAYSLNLMAASSGSDHAALVITFQGRGLQNGHLARILAETKTPVVLLCAASYEPPFENIAARLDWTEIEHHFRKISSFSTRVSLLYVLDVLYSGLFSLDYENNLDRKFSRYHRINPSAD